MIELHMSSQVWSRLKRSKLSAASSLWLALLFMTTMVNATTAPTLVGKLGITALPAARHTLLKMFHDQLVLWCTARGHPDEVVVALKHMLEEAATEIAHQKVATTGPAALRSNSDVENLVASPASGGGSASQ